VISMRVSGSRSRFILVAGLVLIIFATLRIATTYPVFTQTYDEPWHIACGMEWLDKGTYTYELWAPPLPRVLVAVGPYLLGARSHSEPNAFIEGNTILYSGRSYWRNLTAARLGTLPFFVLTCAIVWLWASRWFGQSAGLWAMALYTTLPASLGHAGLATPDTAAAAGVLAVLWAAVSWFESPSVKRAVWLGIAGGLALLTKFSAVAFLPACALFAALYVMFLECRGVRIPIVPARQARQLCVSLFVAVLLLWTGYRFSMESWTGDLQDGGVGQESSQVTNLARAAEKLQRIPLPLLQIPKGLYQLKSRMDYGVESYLLGEYRQTGWWYFIAIVLLVKTPLAFLALVVAGCLMTFLEAHKGDWRCGLPAVFALAIIGVCMLSRLSPGVRYVLAFYPLVSIPAGALVARRLRKTEGSLVRAAIALCIALTFMESAVAHPDYMAHFNVLAGRHPESILAESDLDWGQDLERLRLRLNTLGADHVALAYFGTAEVRKSSLPEILPLSPWVPATGYIAVSVHHLCVSYARDGSYGWLRHHRPLERVGRSIFLYYIRVP